MVGAMEDCVAEMQMVIDNYRELREKRPDHPFLGYIQLHEDCCGFDNTEAYFLRFTRPESKRIYNHMRLNMALKGAIMTGECSMLDTFCLFANSLKDQRELAEAS